MKYKSFLIAFPWLIVNLLTYSSFGFIRSAISNIIIAISIFTYIHYHKKNEKPFYDWGLKNSAKQIKLNNTKKYF